MNSGAKGSWTASEVLPVNAPFAWEEVLRYLTRSPDECLWRVSSGRVERLLAFGNMRVLVDVGWHDDARSWSCS